MKQIILISSHSQEAKNILNGDATYLVLKYQLHEGDEVHIYCTKKTPPYLVDYGSIGMPDYCLNGTPNGDNSEVNGKIVAKFIVGKVEKYEIEWFPLGNDRECYQVLDRIDTFDDEEDLYTIISNEQPSFDFNTEYIKGSCLSFDELGKYATNNKGGIGRFATLEITHLEIFDRPRELWEYKKKDISEAMTHWEYERANGCQAPCPSAVYRITRAPQSYCHAWVEE